MKIPPPAPHPYDRQYSAVIESLSLMGYPDVHFYTGWGDFTLGNSTHLFRLHSVWDLTHFEHLKQHAHLANNMTSDTQWRTTAVFVFKRKSRPFLPIETILTRGRCPSNNRRLRKYCTPPSTPTTECHP